MATEEVDMNTKLQKFYKRCSPTSAKTFRDPHYNNLLVHDALCFMQDAVNALVGDIFRCIGELDARFKAHALPTGSNSEGVKTTNLDEFDIMFCIDVPGKLEKDEKHVGFARYKMYNPVDPNWEIFTDDEGYLSREKLREQFEQLVTCAMAECEKKEYQVKFRITTSRLVWKIDHSSGAAVTLCISAEKHGFLKSPEIYIDLVLAISCRDWVDVCKPEWMVHASPCTWPSPAAIDEIKYSGVHLVLKSPLSANEARPQLFRISTSLGEKILFKHMSPAREDADDEDDRYIVVADFMLPDDNVRKKCLVIMKVILQHFIHASLPPDTTPMLPSFAFKTILFYECRVYPDKESWSEDNLYARVLSFIKRLILALKDKRLGHFFMEEVDVLKGIASRSDLEKSVYVQEHLGSVIDSLSLN